MKFAIGIYDEKGRIIKTLARGDHEPGKHFLEWDGTSDAGARVPAGTYYLHVNAEEEGTIARFKVVLR